jgi:hypothetical protein
MNERIKELLEQTDIPHFPILGSLAWVATDHDMKKFAELIIQECLEQIDKIRDGCEDDGEDQQALGAAWAGLAVARYFGVEE